MEFYTCKDLLPISIHSWLFSPILSLGSSFYSLWGTLELHAPLVLLSFSQLSSEERHTEDLLLVRFFRVRCILLLFLLIYLIQLLWATFFSPFFFSSHFLHVALLHEQDPTNYWVSIIPLPINLLLLFVIFVT